MSKTRVAAAAVVFAAAARLSADVVTLPAAASIQGLNPFFSDVRVFNTSYAASLDVTATYRCFIGVCSTPAPQIHFTLAPRQSKAFNDIVANPNAFDAHDTAGGVEFEFSGSEDQLIVTSRLYSNDPLNSVGMFIPGLPLSRAYAASVLTSIRHDPPNGIVAGFRTNVGVFNPGDASALVSFDIFNAGQEIAAPLTRTVPAHSGLQISGIFEADGQGNLGTENASIVVSSAVPLFSYAAVIDNRTADPIFVVGARSDTGNPPTPTSSGPTATRTPTFSGPSPTRTKTPTGPSPTPMGPSPTRTLTPTRTMTPSGPSATPTPTQTGPTATPTQTPTVAAPTATRTPTVTRTPTQTPTQTQTPSGTTHDVTIVSFAFNPSPITIPAGDSVRWTWQAGPHSTTSGSCVGLVCTADGIWNSGTHGAGFVFVRNFPTAGTFTYYCQVHLSAMQGTVIVTP